MKKLILATSVIALSMAGVAQAETATTTTTNTSVKAEVKEEASSIRGALDRAIDKTSNSIDKVANKVEGKYNEMKVSVMGRDNKFTEQSLNADYSGEKLLGKTIVDAKGDKIGTLEDITVDAQGNIKSAIVKDGNFVGIGKKAAFNFNSVVTQQADGKVVAMISENDIKSAQKFESYPAGTYSVKEILDADVETSNKALDADLENITFKGNKAQYLIIKADNDDTNRDSFAAVDFGSVKLLPQKDNEVDIQLSAAQEQSLLAHIATAAQ